MEQPEYTKTPVGLARQPETPEAKCIPASATTLRKQPFIKRIYSLECVISREKKK